DYQFMAYGLILLFSFVLLPRGLAGLVLPRTQFIKRLPPMHSTDRASESGDAPKVMPARVVGTMPLLRVEGLAISFLGLRALDNVTLEVNAGHILGLVGPNGSGKSTLVNIISGIYRSNSGRVIFESRDITGLPDDRV